MIDQFKYNPAPKPCPVRIEQVFAECPGGGLVVDPGYDAEETTAVGKNADGKWAVIKSARLLAKATKGSTTAFDVAKGHGFKTGEFIGFGKEAIAISSITTTDPNKDVINVATAFTTSDIDAGKSFFQAKAAADGSSATAEPIYKPEYVISTGHPIAVNGVVVPTGHGDIPVRLINGANLRKETACIGEDIEALMPGIKLV